SSRPVLGRVSLPEYTFGTNPPVRPASDRRGGRRVGWERWGWLLVGERSEPALGRSRRRREAGRWSGPAWSTRLAVMAAVVTVNDVLDGHVSLDVECLDRIYLNGYVPNLQVGGQVVSFLTAHLGYPIPSPAIMEKIGTAFRRAVASFAEDNRIPVVRF